VVVVRIGEDNEARPDPFAADPTSEEESKQERAATIDEPPSDSQSETTLASAKDQKKIIENQSPIDAAKRVGDTVKDVVEQTPVSVPSSGSSGGREVASKHKSSQSESSVANNREQRLRNRMPMLGAESESNKSQVDSGENAPLRGRVDTAIP